MLAVGPPRSLTVPWKDRSSRSFPTSFSTEPALLLEMNLGDDFLNPFQFGGHDVTGDTAFRNDSRHFSTQCFFRVINNRLMAVAGQLPGHGNAGRTAADDGHHIAVPGIAHGMNRISGPVPPSRKARHRRAAAPRPAAGPGSEYGVVKYVLQKTHNG